MTAIPNLPDFKEILLYLAKEEQAKPFSRIDDFFSDYKLNELGDINAEIPEVCLLPINTHFVMPRNGLTSFCTTRKWKGFWKQPI